ncbi:MAG: DUF2252 family protein [Myxococcales bacterium]|nr:DUF2252 family protein [Myxococcales bacterium]
MRRLALLALLAAACDAPEDGRAAWLQTTLVLDNQVFLDTTPEQGAAKFARMSLSRYAYFRGTLGQYARDTTQAGGAGYVPTAYASAETADIALLGDPHPENIGSFRGADGVLVVDYNDYDAATYGPFHFDVRRLALGLHLAGVELDVEDPQRLAAAAVAGYVDEIAALAGGSSGTVIAAGDDHGEILNHLLRKAAEDGLAREELSDYTRLADGVRGMYFGAVEPPVPWAMSEYAMTLATDEVVPASAEEAELVARILTAWPTTLHDPAVMPAPAAVIKGVSRRLGAGVASFAAPRYYALLEGPSAALEDDVLLELKRVYDPPSLPGAVRLPGWAFADNGARVVAQQRALQSDAACDPLLGHASLGGVSYRVRDRSKYQRGVDLIKIAEKRAEGDFDDLDLEVLADRAGHLLAHAHARAPRQTGGPGLPGIAAALAQDPAGFIAETEAFVAVYAPVVEADYQRFLDILAADGPSLGYTPASP